MNRSPAPSRSEERTHHPNVPWLRGFEDLTREHGFEAAKVEGQLPSDLKGTLYRNGPALHAPYGKQYAHLFDGDGALSAVRFAGGEASCAVRVIQGEGYKQEKQAGRNLFSGYETAQGSFWNRLGGSPLKNVANISVMQFQNQLLALYEGGRPTEIMASDLSTKGEADLGGMLPAKASFSAHPHRVESRKAWYNFTVKYGKTSELLLFELPDQGPARKIGKVPLRFASMVHDFIATEKHLIFFIAPLKLNFLRFMSGFFSYGTSLQWKPELGTEILIVPIDAPGQVRRIVTEPFYQWHYVNAFEEKDGSVAVDFIRYPDFGTNAWMREVVRGPTAKAAQGALYRAYISPRHDQVKFSELLGQSCELATMAPRPDGPTTLAYLSLHSSEEAGHGPFDGIGKFDFRRSRLETFALPANNYPSEPIFAPRGQQASEDDGYLLSLVYDAPSHRSYVAVFDARDPSKEMLAKVWFDQHVPYTFHGAYVSG